jgi:NAD(P)-dependent dehydrogenase (short-subunit alcohol dehydrogenase family)
MASIYQATKFAVEGMIQSLAQEVAAFGIKVTLIEPGPFKTDFISSLSLKNTSQIPAYDPARDQAARMLTPDMFGDPQTTSDAILRVVDAKEPPLHVILGSLLPLVKQIYAARIQSWQGWDNGSGGLEAA